MVSGTVLANESGHVIRLECPGIRGDVVGTTRGERLEDILRARGIPPVRFVQV